MSGRNVSCSLAPIAVVGSAYAVEYLSVQRAQQLLFPDADFFREHHVILTSGQKKEIRKVSGRKQRWDKQRAWEAWQGQRFAGWFLIDDVIGKHEFITYATAVSPEGSVLGVEIMNYRETHGGEVRGEEWRMHFLNKMVSDPFKLDVDIPNISGATLSCRNVTDGVKRLLAVWETVLKRERHE